jgi:hypothetical protein
MKIPCGRDICCHMVRMDNVPLKVMPERCLKLINHCAMVIHTDILLGGKEKRY